MNDFQLFGICYACKSRHFIVKKRMFHIPLGGMTAKSRDLFGASCFKVLEQQYRNGIVKQP